MSSVINDEIIKYFLVYYFDENIAGYHTYIEEFNSEKEMEERWFEIKEDDKYDDYSLLYKIKGNILPEIGLQTIYSKRIYNKLKDMMEI